MFKMCTAKKMCYLVLQAQKMLNFKNSLKESKTLVIEKIIFNSCPATQNHCYDDFIKIYSLRLSTVNIDKNCNESCSSFVFIDN